MNRLMSNSLITALGIMAASPAFGQSQGAYPSYSGQKRMAIIMLSWSDRACPATRQQVVDRMWNDSKSARNYFLDVSRGALEFVLPAGSSGGVAPASTPDVYGPYELSIAAGHSEDITYDNADEKFGNTYLTGSHPVARSLAASDGFQGSNYDYIMYVTPKSNSTGNVLGWAFLNSNLQHIYQVSNSVINHEIGHCFNMGHSNTGLNNNYSSYDCVMANSKVPHIDGPHTYQMGWHPDDTWTMASYGQYEIENLAQPDTDNLKLLRFDRNAAGATSNPTYNFWVEYRKRGVGLDNDLHTSWNQKVTVHMSPPSSRRPGDTFNSPLSNEMRKFAVGGSYTGPNNTCTIRFLRQESSNSRAIVQLIDPNGNQPPNVTPNIDYKVNQGTTAFNLLATDPENDSLTYTIVSHPASGTLSNVGSSFSYTATTSGTFNFVVRVNDGQYDSFDQTLSVTVSSAATTFADWSGGVSFDDDANGDDVTNGIAWLLGAADPNIHSANLLPSGSESTGNLILSFTCLRQSQRSGAILRVQCSPDLGASASWASLQAEVPDADGIINGISFTVSPNANPALNDVQASIPAESGNRMFGRLHGTPSP